MGPCVGTWAYLADRSVSEAALPSRTVGAKWPPFVCWPCCFPAPRVQFLVSVCESLPSWQLLMPGIAAASPSLTQSRSPLTLRCTGSVSPRPLRLPAFLPIRSSQSPSGALRLAFSSSSLHGSPSAAPSCPVLCLEEPCLRAPPAASSSSASLGLPWELPARPRFPPRGPRGCQRSGPLWTPESVRCSGVMRAQNLRTFSVACASSRFLQQRSGGRAAS